MLVEGKILKKYKVRAYSIFENKIIEDIFFAYSQEDLEEKLKILSLSFLSKKELKETYFLSRKELIVFFEVLSDLLSASVPLKIALENIKTSTSNKKLRDVLNEIIKSLESGVNFSSSLKRLKGLFPDFVLAMIETSEVAGTLTQTLKDLENFYKELDKILSEIKKQIISPFIKVGIILFLFFIFSIFILPRLMNIPLFKIGLNPFVYILAKITYYFSFVLVFFVFIIVLSYFFLSKFNPLFLEKILRKIPFVKDFYTSRDIFLFYYTLSFLTKEIPLHIALELVSKNIENEKIKKQVNILISKLKKGEDFYSYFPEITKEMELILKNAVSNTSFYKVFENLKYFALKRFYNKIYVIPALANLLFYILGIYMIFLLFFLVVNTYLNSLVKIK